MSVITLEDVKTYLGGKLTPNQEDLVSNLIIPGIQGELETYLNTFVELVQVRESLQPEADGYVYFTHAPVRRLLNIQWSQVGAAPITVQQYTPPEFPLQPGITRPVVDHALTSSTASPWRYNIGLIGFPGLFISSQPAYVVTDYVAGLDGGAEPAIKMQLLRVTAREVEREFDTSTGVRAGVLEPASESDSKPKGWQPEELQRLKRYKRLVIA